MLLHPKLPDDKLPVSMGTEGGGEVFPKVKAVEVST